MKYINLDFEKLISCFSFSQEENDVLEKEYCHLKNSISPLPTFANKDNQFFHAINDRANGESICIDINVNVIDMFADNFRVYTLETLNGKICFPNEEKKEIRYIEKKDISTNRNSVAESPVLFGAVSSFLCIIDGNHRVTDTVLKQTYIDALYVPIDYIASSIEEPIDILFYLLECMKYEREIGFFKNREFSESEAFLQAFCKHINNIIKIRERIANG